MENKLQQLTEKLYAEGLAKGRAEGEAQVKAAQDKSAKIIADANTQAEKIIAQAKQKAAELDHGTKAELRLAATQLTSELRSTIESVITAKVTQAATAAAWNDGEFVKKLTLAAVASFNPNGDAPVVVTIPAECENAITDAVAKEFSAGVEIVTNGKMKTPLKISPKDGSYYVSLTQEDFDTLFRSYVRPIVARMLYGE